MNKMINEPKSVFCATKNKKKVQRRSSLFFASPANSTQSLRVLIFYDNAAARQWKKCNKWQAAGGNETMQGSPLSVRENIQRGPEAAAAQ